MIEFLHNIKIKRTRGKYSYTYPNCIITLDTETSKIKDNIIENGKYMNVLNYVVAYSVTILNVDTQEVYTKWGRKPSELINDIKVIHRQLPCDKTFIYIHNLAYDWQFIRKFVYREFGAPKKQLNVKSHRPIMIELGNGITFKDSLIIAQRSLEKWAKDLDVEHKKAVGKWEYGKIRTQHECYTDDEVEYFTFDTISLAECLYKTMKIFKRSVYSIPITATSVPRNECFKIGSMYNAKQEFLRMALDAKQQRKMEKVYHGGYTHANRYIIGNVIEDDIECYDFSSSYPYVMLSEKYPMEKFTRTRDMTLEDIFKDTESAYIFKLVLLNVKIKKGVVMPTLQHSKLESSCNIEVDNGRVLSADYIEIYTNEVDAKIIYDTYDFEYEACVECEQAYKDYLPKWFTDYVYKCFIDKTQYKGGDSVLYAIAKAILNSLYGMCVQHPVQDLWVEDIDGCYVKNKVDFNTEYEKYVNKKTSILPYSWGVWVTSYACKNLMALGDMCEKWLYSDTDSVYGIGFDRVKLMKYNESCITKLKDRGYEPVLCNNNGKYYSLGIASLDGEYKKFVTQGSKRYCCEKNDGSLKLTVAGVPKNGVQCLKNIYDFKRGKIFDGNTTGKLQHAYMSNEIMIINGNEIADCVDLTPSDYLLGEVDVNDIFIEEEVYIAYYG